MAEEMREAAGEDEQELANEMAAVFLDENLPENVFGAPKAGSGNWASCIRIMDPIRGKSVQKIKLDQNEAAMRYNLLFFSKPSVQTYIFCDVIRKGILAFFEPPTPLRKEIFST